MMKPTRHQGGFTLIELILALALFSFVLLIISMGLIQIIHLYQSGLAARNAQTNSRTAFEEISRIARVVATAEVVSGGATEYGKVCLYETNINDKVAYQLRKMPAGAGIEYLDIYRYDPSDPVNYTGVRSCDNVNLTPGSRLTSTDVAMVRFRPTVTPAVASPGQAQAVSIELVLAARNGVSGYDVITSPLGVGNHMLCDPAGSFAHFCSVSAFDTTISLRGHQ